MTQQEMDQCMDHLRIADETRMFKARLKRFIRQMPKDEGKALVRRVLTEPRDFEGAFKVRELLRCPRSMGPTKAERICRQVTVDPNARLRELSVWKRTEIAKYLQ